MFTEKRINKPQFISFQHHKLDRILRLVMNEELGCKTQSPNIEYPFVSQLLKEYEATLAFILIPSTRTVLQRVCLFISYGWADHWFTDQLCNENNFNNLAEVLNPY